MFRAVWGSLLGMALVMAVNPALLALILLVIARSRPVQNLLVCWAGCVISNIPALLVPVLLLQATPMFRAHASNLATSATSTTVRHVQLGMGAFMIVIAALLTLRTWVRQRSRQRTLVPAPGGNGSVLVEDPDAPKQIMSPFGNPQDGAMESQSGIRRLIARLQNAWENGTLWIALVVGMGFLPGPPLVLFVATTIGASGAAIGTQVFAVVVFVLVMFAVFEVVLISHLAAPARTQAILEPLNNWARAHFGQFMIGIFAMVGVFQLAKGSGIL
jgi:Sap, sulfolipid-1-addressing protein